MVWHCLPTLLFLLILSSLPERSQPQNTVPESLCSLNDGASVINVQVTRSSHCEEGSREEEKLVDEIRLTKERTTELNDVLLQLQSTVLRLSETNSKLSDRLHITENELRDVKLALALNNGVSKGCPTGYPVYDERSGSCYAFVNRDVNWFDAQTFCASTGGHLVAVEDQLEHTFLLEHIRKSEDLQGRHFWTGGNDIAKENEWIWTGINMDFNYTQWLRYPHDDGGIVQQPDNHLGEEHCVHLFYLHQYEWNDIYCGYEYFFICEYKLLK